MLLLVVAVGVIAVGVVLVVGRMERRARAVEAELPSDSETDNETMLREINEHLKGISRRMDRKFVRNLTVMILGVLLALLAVGVAQSSSHDAHAAEARAVRAERALADYKVANQAARIGACEQYNAHERTQAQIEKNEERARQAENTAALRRLLVLLQITPADLAVLQAEHLRKYDATVDRAHALRDCSPAGIERFLQGVTTTTAGTLP